MKLKVIAVGFLALGLCSCGVDYDEVFEKYGQTEETKFAIACLESVRVQNFETVVPRIAGESLPPGVDVTEKLAEIALYFPKGEPAEIKLVDHKWVKLQPKDTKATNLTFQYRGEDGWAVASVSLVEDSRGMLLSGLWVNRIPEPLETMNTFTLKGKSSTHYAFIFLTIAIPILIVWSLVRCIRTPIRRLKWLWVIFILIGFCALSINWSTGEVGVQLVTLRVPAVIPQRMGLYGPWVLTVSIPVGAIVFLLRRDALALKAIEEDRR
jgi:hypothetical protein